MRAVVGIQGQDLGAAALGVRARLAGTTATSVERALYEQRSVARVPCMRGTLHLVAAGDVRWLVGLLGPVGLRRSRARFAQMGVDGDRALEVVGEVLAEHGPLTRHEVAAEARARGVRLADHPQAPVHLVGRAAMAGLVCEAGVRDGKPAYALVDEWLGERAGDPLDRDDALAELTRRYVAAHAPAGPEDLAAWSGLGIRDARRGFELAEAGDPQPPPARRTVRLLPTFDGFLLAHRDRSLTVRPEHARAVLPGGGVLRPTLIVDGVVEGTWRIDRGRPKVDPFAKLPPDVGEAVEREAADVVRHRSG